MAKKIKQRFLNTPTRFAIFILFAIAFVAVLYGADRGRRETANQVVDWLPSGFKETVDFNWFLSHFYEGELLMVSWDGCKVDDPALDQIAAALTSPHSDGSPARFWKVMTTSEVMSRLTREPLGLSDDEAFERMQGWIVSKDFNQGCYLAFFSDSGYADPAAALQELREKTMSIAGISESDLHAAGTSVDSVAIDEASAKSQAELLPIFLFVCVVALFCMTRSFQAVFVVFFMAIFNEELTAALMWFTHTKMDSISVLSASLLFVLTISGSLHLLNYYRDNISRNGRRYSVTRALRHAFTPCCLACLTTVLGLFSLTVSKVIPIQKFGRFSTLTLFIGTALFLLGISAFLEQFPIMKWRYQSDELYDEEDNYGLEWSRQGVLIRRRRRKQFGSFRLLSEKLPSGALRFRNLLIIVNIAALIFFACQVPRLRSTVTFHGMFPKDARVIQDYDYLESRIGGLVPIEVVLSTPKAENKDASPSQQLNLLCDVESAALEVDGVESSLSALNFIPYVPEEDRSDFRAISARAAFNRSVKERLDEFRDGCLFDDRELPDDSEYGAAPSYRWRLSLRVLAGAGLDYGDLLQRLRQAVDSQIAARQSEYGLTGSTALITGGVPLAHKAQSQLLDDLANSYVSAFGLILLTLIILLRGVVAGLIAMIPNVFPSAVVFGFMALIKAPVDMGSMMTASVALGVSVDGTIHFLNWYRQAMGMGKSPEEAVRFAYRQCAAAMTQTSIICGGGMLVFTFSSFLPVSRFAWMMAVLLAISLYGDLVLFPPMLVGRLARFYRPAQIRPVADETSNVANPRKRNGFLTGILASRSKNEALKSATLERRVGPIGPDPDSALKNSTGDGIIGNSLVQKDDAAGGKTVETSARSKENNH